MNEKIEGLEAQLTRFYGRAKIPEKLSESVIYSLMVGGKRIRPLMFLTMLEGFGCELTEADFQVAASVEMIHTGSLIHDDLPAMDDDDYRRGQLTNHKKFDEATAILAADSLFLDPYYVLSTAELPADKLVRLVQELSYASGSLGMVAGQVLDMAAEGEKLTLAELAQLHSLKTGRLLTFPFVAAGIIAGKSDMEIETLRVIGQKVGLAFQIRDDILDVTASFEEIGKTPGKDLTEEKSTYVSLLGIDEAKNQLTDLMTEVKASLSALTDFDASEMLKMIDSLELQP